MVLTFPSLLPQEQEFLLVSNAQAFTSPMSSTTQAVAQLGNLWVTSLTFEILAEDQWRDLAAFAAEMDGLVNRVYLGPFAGRTPRGLAGGTPVVNGSDQVGKTIATTGWPPNTPVLKRGDYFHFNTSVGRELKIVRSDVTSDSEGHATIPFEPSIRVSPPHGASIVTDSPTCVMRFVDASQGRILFKPPRLGSVTLDFIEAP